MEKRSILIDLRYLAYLNNGFGQLALNYGNYFKDNPEKIQDLDITLLVPKEYINKFGNNIKYLEYKRNYKVYPFLLPHYDIWHSITQQVKTISLHSNTVRIISVHDLNFLYERGTAKAKRKLKRQQAILDIADIITAISYFTISELEQHIGLKGKTVLLNYVGKRSIADDEAVRPESIDSSRKFFFTIGQVLEKKNFHVLLDMMKLMPAYNLYISGDNTFEYAKYIETRIAQEQICNVFLTGPISAAEKVWMYRNCEAFLFPSKFEGFGLPLIEAMLFGKPVFSSRYTSLPEVGNKYAFFWDNFDAKHMKEVVEKNLNRFYEDTSFIEQQVEYANSYTLERHMGAFLDLYRTVPLKRSKNPFNAIYNYIKFLQS